ncbi:MAG: SDR family NAD(P)-dependent oxidoreductase, partial [Anaerolineae bacterium]|nr:SDR family NAD(P)-dependent oxidoreductase [Anaerolineae bacterium]
MRFKGKTAVITGGANGIGAGCVQRLAQEGANVMIADIDDHSATALVAELEAAAGTVQYTRTDVTRRESVQALFDATVDT